MTKRATETAAALLLHKVVPGDDGVACGDCDALTDEERTAAKLLDAFQEAVKKAGGGDLPDALRAKILVAVVASLENPVDNAAAHEFAEKCKRVGNWYGAPALTRPGRMRPR